MKPASIPVIDGISDTRHHSGCHLGRTLTLLAGVVGFCAFHAKADVVVTDNGSTFSPDPVNIVVGQAVLWKDDGSGPYQITSATGAWTPFNTPGGILFSQSGTYSYYDDVGNFGTVQVSPNIPPSVTITNPATNAVFSAPASFLFAADASDPDADGVSDVEFYVGTNLVDDVFSSPFATTVTNLTAGTYQLTAIAYDNAGATATNSITIYVGGITLITPRVVAGRFLFSASGLTPGKTNVLQTSTDLITSGANWVPLATNVATAGNMSFTNAAMRRVFFRLIQLP